ncbi:MAG: DEAD/DEAH box helicase [Bacteroidetes bacterium]|nr:DEAD/DEAH box helicase [Bacteroidota bacterium]
MHEIIVHPKAHGYQARALEFSLNNRDSYQALKMGLGKTLVSLMWILNIEPKATLVIAPIKVMYNTWPAEIEKWAPGLTYTIVHGPDKLTQLHKKVNIYLTNFESIVWLYEALKKMKCIPFDAIIIDEGTMIKDSKTKRWKKLRAMREMFPKGKMVLSGTPMPNSMLNLWTQYFFLDGGVRLHSSFGEYQVRYFDPQDKDGRVWTIKSPGVAAIIHKRIRDITFTLDPSEHIKLPPVIYNFIKLTLPPKLQKMYNALEEDYFLRLSENKAIEVFNSMALSMKLRQFIQGALYTDTKGTYEVLHTEKVEALKELVEASDGTPILCAIQFIFELDLICKAFPGTPVIRGGVSNTEATRLVNAWNRRELPLLLCHPKSISHGMNMQTGGNHILWFGIPWSGEQYEQLGGRLARQGQEADNVVMSHLIMKSTIDVAIAASLRNKAKGQQAMLDYINAYHKGEIIDI